MPFQNSTGLSNISKYIVDANGDTPYTTIQSALDAANTAGIATAVYVRAGTYTEDLTLYDGIDLWGAVGVADTETCKIIGTHTPPAAGTFTCRNIFLESLTDIFNSAVAGTAALILIDCAVDVTNGYTFNLVNWTGSFTGFDIGEIQSTNDGWINNTGGAEVFMVNITMGAGAGNTCIISGDCELFNVHCQCPITFQGTGTTFATGGCWFSDTVTTAATATVRIANGAIETGLNTGINHGSANELVLSDLTLHSENVVTIAGAGAGLLRLGSVTYLGTSALAGTLTVDRTTAFDTGVVRATTEELIGSGAGAQEVIEITPAIAIGGVHWDGIHIDGAALDPTAANADIHGTHIDLSGVSVANDPIVVGLRIEMPAAFSGDAAKDGVVVDGFGYTAELCSGDHGVAVLSQGPIQQEYDGTGAVAGVSLSAFDSIIDYDGSTGGEIHAIDVSVSGTGTATVAALATFTDVAPLHQHIGAFGAVAQGWKENGGFTDTTAAFNAAGVDVTVFDADNDYIYIGSNAIFDQIQVILDTPATRSVLPIFEYSIGGPAWTVFTPTDNTDGFTQNGSISFDSGDLAGWASVVVNAANHYYIRIQRTRNNIGTIPIEDTIQILAATEYYWDETGNTLVNISYATTFDTNVAAAGLTLTGETLAADGTDANIDISITPKGTGVLLTDAIGNAADTTAIAITAAGEVTLPLQPAFMVWLDTTVANVTGNGTDYLIIYDTEEFDVNADFTIGTGVFTAPVTGKYRFDVCVQVAFDGVVPTTADMIFKVSNRSYRFYRNTVVGSVDENPSVKGAIIADMDATDTCSIEIDYSGGLADNMDVSGDTGGEPNNWFCGNLAT